MVPADGSGRTRPRSSDCRARTMERTGQLRTPSMVVTKLSSVSSGLHSILKSERVGLMRSDMRSMSASLRAPSPSVTWSRVKKLRPGGYCRR